ncbi:MAG: lysophospholipid acyltransferase family protein [Gemmatimonadales bacterium]
MTSTRHRLEHLAFRLARRGAAALPERWALSAGAWAGRATGSVVRFRRGDVERHLAWAFPDSSAEWRRRTANACYAHFGREAAVVLRAAGWSAEDVRARTRMHGFEPFVEAVGEGHGVVLLTGHLGNWEMGGAAIAARGVALDVVGKGMSNRSFQDDLFAARSRLGMRVIEMGDASREALRSLGQGRVVAFLGDQHAHRGGVPLPFFGRDASTSRGAALFALRVSAPVFVAFCIREAGDTPRYGVTFRALPVARSGDVDQDVLALLGAYGRELERAIEAAPAQYFWHHRRWKGAI